MPSMQTSAVGKTFVVEFDTPKRDLAEFGAVSPQGVPFEVNVTVSLDSDDCAGYVRGLPRILAEARRRAAETMLDRTRYSTDEAMAGAVRDIEPHLEPVAVLVEAAGPRQAFVVTADYARDEGQFGDSFEGVDAEEAKFQALWVMTENAGYSASADPEGFAGTMARHRIRDVIPEPTPERRMAETMADLIREVRAAGHEGPALDAALALAEKSGLDVSPPQSLRM